MAQVGKPGRDDVACAGPERMSNPTGNGVAMLGQLRDGGLNEAR